MLAISEARNQSLKSEVWSPFTASVDKGVRMILKKEWLSANYCKGCCPQSPLPPTATALRTNKPKNIYRFTICFTLSM